MILHAQHPYNPDYHDLITYPFANLWYPFRVLLELHCLALILILQNVTDEKSINCDSVVRYKVYYRQKDHSLWNLSTTRDTGLRIEHLLPFTAYSIKMTTVNNANLETAENPTYKDITMPPGSKLLYIHVIKK